MLRIILAATLVIIAVPRAFAQDEHHHQTDFPPQEFRERRTKLFDAIGPNALAVIQGAPAAPGFQVFRQSNQFYYLCGVETAHSYLLLDGRSRRTTLFLPHRDKGRERNEGKVLSAEDAELLVSLTGVDEVLGVEGLAKSLQWKLVHMPAPAVYTPFSPAEGSMGSRDELLGTQIAAANDPWDGRPSREGRFHELLRGRFPQLELRDLSPILDRMRAVKSPREIDVLRQAARLSGLGLMEAMRSTRPGVMEYQLDAAAQYHYLVNGARGPGYPSIVGGGTNAWMGHYFQKDDALREGDLVLMDAAPDLRYYTSDMARTWPVGGRFSPAQRELCGFILAIHEALLARIRPGVTAAQILDEVAPEMRAIAEGTQFSKPTYREAALAAANWRGHLSHPVGMAVHDVGGYSSRPLEPGVVFAVDPMMWIPDEKLYIRIEDTVVVTEDGIENLTGFVPSDLDAIEALMAEPGLVQLRPSIR